MALLARRNIRAVGTNELLFPVMEVERIELIRYERSGEVNEIELYHFGDGTSRRPHELLFLEPVDDDLLIAMRLEAQILAAGGEPPKRRRK